MARSPASAAPPRGTRDEPSGPQSGAEPFYARVLPAREREGYAQALNQQGLAGEVAVLRLHLLRLVQRDDPAHWTEIPRTVHALVRALKDGRAGDDTMAALDAAVCDEGRRLLGEDREPGVLPHGEPGSLPHEE